MKGLLVSAECDQFSIQILLYFLVDLVQNLVTSAIWLTISLSIRPEIQIVTHIIEGYVFL